MRRRSALVCALFVVGGTPAHSQTSQPTPEDMLRQAIAARDAAIVALQQANKAIEDASAILNERDAGGRAVPKVVSAARVDDLCIVNGESPGRILSQADKYAPSCLQKASTTDIRLTGILQDDKAAIVGAYTKRRLHTHDDGTVHNTYYRFRLGFTQAKRGDRFPIFDFAGSQWLRGWGLTGGYEFGRTASRTTKNAQERVAKYLATARRDCIAEKLAEPVTDPLRDQGAVLRVRTSAEAQASCDGTNLSSWMGDDERRDKFYKAFNTAVFQPEKVRALYGGVNISASFPQFEYVPAENLPTSSAIGQPAKPDGKKVDFTTHELRAYFGGYTSEHFALEAGFSHRRTFEQSDKRTICPVGTTGFIECWGLRTEPPSELRGFVADARAALLVDPPLLPQIGLLVMPSYEFDTKRWSANGSIFFAVDDDGCLSSGLSLRCKGAGEDRAGKKLDKDCKAEIFVATSFTVRPKN